MVTLRNSLLEVRLKPEAGGRIDDLIDLRDGHNWLWHPEGYRPEAPRNVAVGDSFDDHWQGGWEEIFPNDMEGDHGWPDHGELWSRAWELVELSPLGAQLRLECQHVPARVTKTLRLDSDSANLRVRYAIENLSEDPLPFLFKLHPAIAIAPGDEIRMPPCEIEPVELGFSSLLGRAGKTPWPWGRDAEGNRVEIHRMPERNPLTQEFVYASGLARGECGVRRAHNGSELRLNFSSADFPYVWVFQSHGRWRGHYVLMLEPATTMPYDLSKAIRARTCAHLRPSERREWFVDVEVR